MKSYICSPLYDFELNKMDCREPVITTTCLDCKIPFSSFEAFKLHSVEQHQDIKEEPSDILNSQLIPDSPNQIEKPNNDYSERQLRECVVSEVDLYDVENNSLSSKERKNFKTKHTSSKVKALGCPNCSYIAKTEYSFQKHIQTQHNPHRKIYSCQLCDYFCLQERTFLLHVLKHSDQDAKFACDQCGKLFVSMGIMKRHALTHNKLKTFNCDVGDCRKGFNIKSRLTDHVRTVHKKNKIHGKKPDNDDLCQNYNAECLSDSTSASSKICDNLDEIAQNKRVENSLQESDSCSDFPKQKNCPLPCNSKDREFSLTKIEDNKNAYVPFETNLKTESGDVTNVINIYDIILPQNGSDSHSNNVSDSSSSVVGSNASVPPTQVVSQSCISITVHNQIMSTNPLKLRHYSKIRRGNRTSQFTCSWAGCGKTFRDGYNLRMHTSTHTGEMQRACDLCHYTCVQKSALDKHIMKVHGKRRK